MANGIIFIVIAIVSIIIYYAFVLPHIDKVLFRLYEQRDNLALYAMNNPGKQDTTEYKYLIDIINTQLYLVNNDISFVDFFESTIKQTVDNQRKVERTIKRIKRDEYMDEIFESSFSIFCDYLSRRFNLFYYLFLLPIQFIFSILISIFQFFDMNKLYSMIDGVRYKAKSTSKIFNQYMGIVRP